jgi:hypothetical protein
MCRLTLLLLLARGAPAAAAAPRVDVGVRLSGCAAAGVGAAVCDAGPLLPSPTLSCGGAPVFFAAAPSPDDGSTLALRYAGGGEWQLLRACGVQRLCFLDGGSSTCAQRRSARRRRHAPRRLRPRAAPRARRCAPSPPCLLTCPR